jgi:S1-C subfamily serine protease
MIECVDKNKKGTGFFISDDGVVVTNNHVVSERTLHKGAIHNDYSSDIWVTHRGIRHQATLLIGEGDARPMVFDYALLRVQLGATTPIPVTSIRDAKQGETVVCLGFPLDFSILVATSGIISASVKRPSHLNSLYSLEAILTDALVNFGNSGGPLIHVKSNSVVGIVTLKHGVQDYERTRLQSLLADPRISASLGMTDLITFSLNNLHVGLNYAISLEYALADPSVT